MNGTKGRIRSVKGLPTLQAWAPEFDSQHPLKTAGVVAEAWASLANQPVEPNQLV